MKMYRALALLPFFVTGCSSTEMQGALNSLNGVGQSISANLKQVSPASVGTTSKNSLLRTPLYNALRQNISTDGRAPEWPKVVITNLDIPADQRSLSRSLTLKANDCVHFDAVLWHDARRSEHFENLSLCAPDLPKQSNNFVLTWKSFSVSGKTTGQARTDGPTPPYSKLPSDAVMDSWVMNQFGLYYVGSMLTLVGYDPNFSVDDRRFWIKNIK
ncbi:hypothetical protein [Pseudomonas sp. LAM2023]|uniref:hypothetical protein n=1 Tax=Pseudomonas sp. LAM2023 TaxID=2800477 RepID=UPI001F3D52D6|nr:hypothetical protein [Pseudomonas sp. LAM2023]